MSEKFCLNDFPEMFEKMEKESLESIGFILQI